MTTGFLRGHPIVYVNGEWLYSDTRTPTAGNERACGHCQRDRDGNGHDGCLGVLPGVMNACCGHGTEGEAYVQIDADNWVGGTEALEMISRLRNHSRHTNS